MCQVTPTFFKAASFGVSPKRRASGKHRSESDLTPSFPCAGGRGLDTKETSPAGNASTIIGARNAARELSTRGDGNAFRSNRTPLILSVFRCCRVFARWRSTQFLDEALDILPTYITACLCLHNLVEASHEWFDEMLLEPEPGFEFCLIEHDEEPVALDADDVGVRAASAAERAERHNALQAAPTPQRRREIMADWIWDH